MNKVFWVIQILYILHEMPQSGRVELKTAGAELLLKPLPRGPAVLTRAHGQRSTDGFFPAEMISAICACVHFVAELYVIGRDVRNSLRCEFGFWSGDSGFGQKAAAEGIHRPSGLGAHPSQHHLEKRLESYTIVTFLADYLSIHGSVWHVGQETQQSASTQLIEPNLRQHPQSEVGSWYPESTSCFKGRKRGSGSL